ncbi:MAG: hypothetical protein J1F12_05025 [Muribaculaceae bacterium]|nr:hypothetical protein [Muribaculaceae bacterium]
MNKWKYKISPVYLLLGFITLLYSCGNGRGRDSWLQRVDDALETVDVQQKLYAQRADSISKRAKEAINNEEKFTLLLEASDAYRTLDLNKSINFLLDAYEIATLNHQNPSDSVETLLRLASIYNTQGFMLKEVSDILATLDPGKLNGQYLTRYYITKVQLNRRLADVTNIQRLKVNYLYELKGYQDSLLKMHPENDLIRAKSLEMEGKIDEALQIMLNAKKESADSIPRTGPYFHTVAQLYEKLEKPDSQLIYLALAAEDDLKHGVKEYSALTDLAELIYPFDLNRAHRYILQSREDAISSHSSLRQRQMGPIYTLINGKYAMRQNQILVGSIILSVSLFIAIMAVVAGGIMLKKKNRELGLQGERLRESKKIIENTNQELEETNRNLKEESRIKESYIRSFMNLCLQYLNKMEHYRAYIGKIASGGDLQKVVKAINSSRYVNQEVSEFYQSFDEAFLSLYPDFKTVLNGFLREGEKYEECGSLTTELRVYALIWLGIESSGEIAKFLRCSESTVYNYRTVMRNRAKDRNKFEKDFILVSEARRHKPIYKIDNSENI